MRFRYAFLLALAALQTAVAQTPTLTTFGMAPGSNPRSVQVRDTSGTWVTIGTLDATNHKFNFALTGTSTLARSGIMGTSTSNPYGTTYPSYLYGIGGSSYYDTKPLATNNLYFPNGSVAISNQVTYGALNTAQGLVVNANSNRPGCVAGYTAAAQVGSYDEFGGSALCSQADTVPVMWAGTGIYSATSFTPTTPIPQSDTVFAAVGMWVRSSDDPAFNGQITSFTVNGSNAITSLTVDAWYRRGGGTGTPSGSAYLNPQDKVWTRLNVTTLNKASITCTTAITSTVLSSCSSTTGIIANGNLVSGSGIPTNTVIIGISGTTLFMSKAATATATVPLAVSLGTDFNKAVGEEADVQNNGPAFTPMWLADTGSWSSGAYTVTGLVLTSQWRPGLQITGVGIGPGNTNFVTSVNYGANTLNLRYQTTGVGAVTAIKGQNQFDEGGTQTDCFANLNTAQACLVIRGAFAYGVNCMGATDTCFLVRPQNLAALPLYGFRVDVRDNGGPTTAAFAVTSNTTNLASIDSAGNISGQVMSASNAFAIAKRTFAALPACGVSTEGWMFAVTDSTTATFNAAIAGGGANHGIAYCNASAWVFH